jgi:hypothetical protein
MFSNIVLLKQHFNTLNFALLTHKNRRFFVIYLSTYIMLNIIRKLTHDNDEFDSQWYDIRTELTQNCDKGNISSTLDALADYILQEPQTSKPSEHKFKFVTCVIDTIDYKNQHKVDNSILDHVFQVFIRVFDQGQIDLWHLTFLQKLYQYFELKIYLSRKIPLVEQLLLSLQKHSFTLTSENKSTLESWKHFWRNDIFDDNLLNEKVFGAVKDTFQQLCR